MSARTLAVQDCGVWLWPGIPLTVKLDGIVEPLPAAAIRFWTTRLHGFEADPDAVLPALRRAAACLTRGDEPAARRALDSSGLDRLSPEGSALAAAIGRRLGIDPPDFAVGLRSAPWGAGEIGSDLPRFDGFANAAARLRKAWESDKHPRWPAGAPDRQGGRFSPAGTGATDAAPSAAPGEAPRIGHNGGPPLEPPPEIPSEPPPTAKLRNIVVKAVARWLLKAALRGIAGGPVVDFITLVPAASWLYDKYPYISAYLDQPKSLDELQRAVDDPQKGYEIHHIVEQTPAERDRYPRSLIDSPENLVRIPTLKHWEITGWYMSPNKKYGGLAPRDYLKGKSWEERRRVGIDALRKYGVLTP